MDDKGKLDQATVLQQLSTTNTASYDTAREALKRTNLDASGKIELEDWVQLHALLKEGKGQDVEAVKGKIAVQGTKGTNAQHTINEDERRSFTDHINAVSKGTGSRA